MGAKKVVKMLAGSKTKAGLMLRPWVVLDIYAVLLALYVALLHAWLMNRGATEAEQRMALPGDEVTASPETTYFTRAITINAPTDEVWPWLVQIGQDRAGSYSNDWLENIFLADIRFRSTVGPTGGNETVLIKWLFAALLVLQVHFATSYLVPLDREAQGTFGGLLRWAWPWSDGDSGPLGQVTVSSGFPLSGFFLAVTAAVLFFLAALAVVGIWVPFSWWRVLAVGGAILSIFLMAAFFGPTKLLPMALDLVVLWAAITNWLQPTD